PDGVAGAFSSLYFPAGLAVDASNDLYIADWQNYLIRKVVFTDGPVVRPGGVVNAASLASPPNAFAPGSLISIAGFGLTSASGETSVEVNEISIPLVSVSADAIQAQLPVELGAGQATLIIRNKRGASRKEIITIEPAAPGI